MPHAILGLILLTAAPAAHEALPPPPNAAALDDRASGASPAPASPGPGSPPESTTLPLADPIDPAAPLPAPSASGPADQTPEASDGIVVSGHRETPKEDPLEQANALSYEAVQAIDQAIVAPVAMGYKNAVPEPVRHGIRNFINNLDEPVAALNYLLQLKPGKAAETLGRFAINSTLGIGGLVDVAKQKPFNLPRRYNGLANTLGYYGVGPGPYLFLPIIGPTTLRDVFGRVVDFSIVPRVVGPPLTNPEVTIGKTVLGAISDRIADDTRIRQLRDQSDDGYGEIRRNYLERRQGEIDALRGKPAKLSDAAPPPAPGPVAPQP